MKTYSVTNPSPEREQVLRQWMAEDGKRSVPIPPTRLMVRTSDKPGRWALPEFIDYQQFRQLAGTFHAPAVSRTFDWLYWHGRQRAIKLTGRCLGRHCEFDTCPRRATHILLVSDLAKLNPANLHRLDGFKGDTAMMIVGRVIDVARSGYFPAARR